MKPTREPVDPGENEELHRAVVRFAAMSSWIIALGLAVAALITGDRTTLVQAAGAGVAGLVFIVVVRTPRPNAKLAMVLGIAAVTTTTPFIRTSGRTLAAEMAVAAMATIIVVLTGRHRLAIGTLTAVLLAASPLLWTPVVTAALTRGAFMVMIFLVGTGVVLVVRNRTALADEQFRLLFERAPVGLVEQDWSGAMELVESIRPRNAEDLRASMATDEELLARIVSRIKVVRANDAVAEILRVPLRQLVGRYMSGRVEPTSRAVWIRQVVGMWVGRPFDVFEYETTDYQGNPGLWIEVRTIATGKPDPYRVILAVTDTTASRQRSRELADLVKEKDEFIATVSHELRTPLTAVVGMATEALTAEDISPEQRKDLLEIVVSQANEIAHLVEDLLVSARAEIGTVAVVPKPIDVEAETRKVLSTLPGEVALVADPDRPYGLADPVRLRQIVRNLLVNAERYGGERRRVVIYARGTRVTIEVRDNGEPIDRGDRNRIFEPYTRAHDRPGMTVSVGLGLSVSRRLARLMDGDLSYAHDGDESVFRLDLPRAPTEQAEATPGVSITVQGAADAR